MADENPLAGLLDRAGNVFSLAGKLGRAFHDEHQVQRGQIDPAGWDMHAGTFNEFCVAVLDLREAMQHPPDGFAPVAEPLLEAARIANRIRDAMQRPDDRTWAAYLGFFPHLNSVCKDGWRAVKEVTKARRLNDPFAFVDEPPATPSVVRGLRDAWEESRDARATRHGDAETVEERIRDLMDRCAGFNETHLRARLRLVFLPGPAAFAKSGEQVRVAFPTTVDHKGAAPEGVVIFPAEALQGFSQHDFWGAARVDYESDPESRHRVLLFMLWGDVGDKSTAESFSQLAGESDRLYQTLPVALAPIHGVSSPRNLWATILYAWLRGTDWVSEGNGFKCIALPFAASAELWRRLLYGTTPDGRIEAAGRETAKSRAAELAEKTVIVNTAGDLWKALDEGRTPGVAVSAISLGPPFGPNISQLKFPETADQSKWDILDRALALCEAEGGDRAEAMRKLIARIALARGVDRREIVNMPLAEFVGAAAGGDPQTIKAKLAAE